MTKALDLLQFSRGPTLAISEIAISEIAISEIAISE